MPSHPVQISALSNDKALSFDVILVSLGTRYQMYCANASRTYLVDPSKKQAPTTSPCHTDHQHEVLLSMAGHSSRRYTLMVFEA